VHKLEDIRQCICTLEVDCNENKQYVTSVHAVNTAVNVSNVPSGDDPTTGCRELVTSNAEASYQIHHPINVSDVDFSCQIKHSVEQHEALSDTCISNRNASVDPLRDVQNSSIRSYDSICSSDSDCLSQSQRPQLSITQKVKMFAMELDMMKVPVSAHDSENSSFSSLTDMSSAVFL